MVCIFDLDGTLACPEHRRHFVDPKHVKNLDLTNSYGLNVIVESDKQMYNQEQVEKFKPDWKSFYETCDKDEPIYETIGVLRMLMHCGAPTQIWSGRCESVRIKTHAWIFAHTGFEPCRDTVKMRPIGDYTPDDQLKERWLDERIKHLEETRPAGLTFKADHDIDFVFDDRPKVVRMWRRRGIFVFDCNQTGEEF